MLWQIPFFIIIINGAVIISAFRYLEAGVIRASLILVSALISYALFIAIVKHHYYYEIELETLNRIEDELGTKRIKRKTFTNDNNKYWVLEPPQEPIPSLFTKFFRFFEIQSSHIALLIGVFLIFLIQIYLVKLAFL